MVMFVRLADIGAAARGIVGDGFSSDNWDSMSLGELDEALAEATNDGLPSEKPQPTAVVVPVKPVARKRLALGGVRRG